jgi:hypothetical protein
LARSTTGEHSQAQIEAFEDTVRLAMPEIGLFDAIYSARALRRLKPDPVPEKIITRILDAAIRAPSAGNSQNWAFIVVRDGEQRRRLGMIYRKAFDRHGQEPVYGQRDPIILRSRKNGSLLSLPPRRDRVRQVEDINAMLASVQFDLSMTGALKLRNNLWLFERLEYDLFDRPHLIRQIVRLDRMTGRRVFTSDIKHHGRFYCPAQNIPGTARLQMTMSGDQVVELDFRSMHASLAYHLCGASLENEDDPYQGITGFTRKHAKRGLLTAFNAPNIQAAVASLADARHGKPVVPSSEDAYRLIESLKVRHAPIVSMLCSDAGMTLMNLDSRIMLAAVDRLIGKGIPCVPIHDSILVAQQHESDAREALNYGWRAQNPSITPCYIDKKPQKAPQYGGGGGGGGGGVPGQCPLVPLSGWWSSVLAEARHDVAEWCA